MSYCVNCGVELAKTEKRCPLCLVDVINPAEQPDGTQSAAMPQRRDVLESAFDRQLWIKLVSILLTVPAAICFVSNMLVHSDVFWSLYVVGGLTVGWTFCVAPFLFKRYFPLLWIVANAAVTLGYLYLVEYLSRSFGWFIPLALPIVLGVAVLSLALILILQRKNLRKLYAAAAVFLAVGLLTVIVEASIGLYARHILQLGWSWFSLISCVAMAGVLVILERQMSMKEKLRRRLHF